MRLKRKTLQPKPKNINKVIIQETKWTDNQKMTHQNGKFENETKYQMPKTK